MKRYEFKYETKLCRVLLKKPAVTQSRNCHLFMEPQGLFSCSQDADTGPYLDRN